MSKEENEKPLLTNEEALKVCFEIICKTWNKGEYKNFATLFNIIDKDFDKLFLILKTLDCEKTRTVRGRDCLKIPSLNIFKSMLKNTLCLYYLFIEGKGPSDLMKIMPDLKTNNFYNWKGAFNGERKKNK